MCNNNLQAIFELLSESEDEYEMLFESSDEEDILSAAVNMCGRNQRACIKNYLSEVVPSYSDEEFKKHFRINRSLYEKLCNMFECSDDYQKLRADKRCAGNKHIALFLWFAGHEACSVRDLADRFNLSQSTVSVLLNRAITFISSLSPCVFQWPNEEEKKRSSDFFQNKSGFPKVIGAIDCTHITIDPPSSAKDDYFDRKGNISIILQAICNEKKKFLDIFVGFPGSSHDSWVFQNSFIYPKLRRACGDYLILGDSAYQCMENLLTPYRDNGHLTRAQKSYNIKLSSCRVRIEHSFGILKQRFRQLYYCKLRNIEKLCHFVRACCVLHNLADESDFDFLRESPLEADVDSIIRYEDNTAGKNLRNQICTQLELQ